MGDEKEHSQQEEDTKEVHSGDKKYGKKIADTITSENGSHVEMPLPVKIKATVHGASVAMHPPVENIKTVHAQSGPQKVHPDEMKVEEKKDKKEHSKGKESVAMHLPVEDTKTVHDQNGLQVVHPDKMEAEENTEKHTQQDQKEAYSNTGSEVDKKP